MPALPPASVCDAGNPGSPIRGEFAYRRRSRPGVSPEDEHAAAATDDVGTMPQSGRACPRARGVGMARGVTPVAPDFGLTRAKPSQPGLTRHRGSL